MDETERHLTRTADRTRRIVACLLSLLQPGAGHFLLGKFRRGIVWACGVAATGLWLLFTLPVTLWAVVIVVVVGFLMHLAAAIDTGRVGVTRPSWKLVITAWIALFAASWTVDGVAKDHYRTHYARAFTIQANSMTPSLMVGDYVVSDNSVYRSRDPERTDIVVFQYPNDERRLFIQRVVALGGETVQVRGNAVLVNGKPLEEPYLQSSSGSTLHHGPCGYAYGCEPMLVPPGSYFVMGDNRDNSQDSRYWGVVRRDKILGRAVVIYWSWDAERAWPRFDRIGLSF